MEAQKDTQKLKSDLSSVAVILSSIYKEKQETVEKVGSKDIFKEVREINKEVREINKALNDEDELNTMSPTSRENYIANLHSSRKRLLEDWKELEAQERIRRQKK